VDVVFGEGPVAVALATRLGREGSTVLVGARPVVGPFLWRHGEASTGKGIKQAVEGAGRVFVVADDASATGGLFLVLRRMPRLRGAVLLPLGVEAPAALAECPTLARVHHGPAWGPEEPLIDAWVRRLLAGRRLWVGDPGPVRPVAMPAVTAAVVEAAFRGPVRWTIAGPEAVRLPELAAELARRLGRPLRAWRVPPAWAARSAGVPLSRLQRWVHTPVTPTVADGWTPPGLTDRTGWVGDLARER
jgi:hypothetical protein